MSTTHDLNTKACSYLVISSPCASTTVPPIQQEQLKPMNNKRHTIPYTVYMIFSSLQGS